MLTQNSKNLELQFLTRMKFGLLWLQQHSSYFCVIVYTSVTQCLIRNAQIVCSFFKTPSGWSNCVSKFFMTESINIFVCLKWILSGKCCLSSDVLYLSPQRPYYAQSRWSDRSWILHLALSLKTFQKLPRILRGLAPYLILCETCSNSLHPLKNVATVLICLSLCTL